MNSDSDSRWPRNSPGSHLFLAGFLIVGGTLLFLGNLGILPVRSIRLYWPMIVVALGISRIMSGPDPVIRLFGGLVAFVGGVFLLINLDLIHIRRHDGSWPISILLIAFGAAMLIKVLDRRDPGSSRWTGFRPLRMGIPNGLTDFTLMGSVKRRVDTDDFRGGNALSVLGNIELDLRHARIAEPGQTTYLEVSAILGGAKIRVPDTWRVQIRGASIMGNYEDKTIPPNVGVNAPTLVITGFSLMSTIEIED